MGDNNETLSIFFQYRADLHGVIQLAYYCLCQVRQRELLLCGIRLQLLDVLWRCFL